MPLISLTLYKGQFLKYESFKRVISETGDDSISNKKTIKEKLALRRKTKKIEFNGLDLTIRRLNSLEEQELQSYVLDNIKDMEAFSAKENKADIDPYKDLDIKSLSKQQLDVNLKLLNVVIKEFVDLSKEDIATLLTNAQSIDLMNLVVEYTNGGYK